ncbi:hypothetical protein ACWDUB_15070 [Streptomyces fungicidicus]
MTVTEVGQGELPVGLARLIHINALACDHNRVLDYRTKQLEVRLLASYLHTAGAGGPLRVDHRAFTASSRHIRGFVAESSGLGMLTAAGEALFAWDNSAHPLHSFDALPGSLTDYQNDGIRPDLLFHLPGGRVAGEARGRHRRAKTLLPKRPLAEQKNRLQDLARWSAAHQDHDYFMSWVWIGRSGVAVDIFLPQDKRWEGALDVRWKRQSEGHQWRFPVHERRRRPPEGPLGQMPTDESEPPLTPPSATDTLRTMLPVPAAAAPSPRPTRSHRPAAWCSGCTTPPPNSMRNSSAIPSAAPGYPPTRWDLPSTRCCWPSWPNSPHPRPASESASHGPKAASTPASTDVC